MEVNWYILYTIRIILIPELLPDFDLKVLIKFSALCVVIIIISLVVNDCKSHLETVILCEFARVVVIILQGRRSEHSTISLMQRDCILDSKPDCEQQYDDWYARAGARREVTALWMVQSDSLCIHIELKELLTLRQMTRLVFTRLSLIAKNILN